MKTRILLKGLFFAMLLAIAAPVTSFGADINSVTPAHREAQMQTLQNRLNEIKQIDMKGLSRHEKKELRKEVKTIKKEMAALSGGVYISIGAILLIALLLILLA
ncbi:MAG TPA: hypothetical protein VD927_05215 [Chryseosolibacter sp.]|nr:hypothetical protein [Chryseosolibacter sp.]